MLRVICSSCRAERRTNICAVEVGLLRKQVVLHKRSGSVAIQGLGGSDRPSSELRTPQQACSVLDFRLSLYLESVACFS